MKLPTLLFCIFFIGSTIFGQPAKQTVNDTTYMLSYDHGGLILWGSDHFRERLENAVQWLDKYPSYKTGLDNEAHIYEYFAESEPEMLKELNFLLKKYKGRFAIGSCTYGQPLSQFINDESNIRQIAYALDAERKYFNYRPPLYLMSEHAMHSQMPQILKGFGFSGAIMRTHYMMYGYNPTFNVPIGLWTGIDGSKISTVPTYPGEGAEFGKTTVDNWILTRYPGNDSKVSPEDYRKTFSNINPLLASRADDSGLRKEELVKEYEKKDKFKWILLDDLLKKYPEPETEMVTKPNDFTVRMPWGYCGNEIWNSSRKAEISVLTAERLAAVELLNGGHNHQEELGTSWKNLLLSQHHDIQIVGLLPDARKLLPVSLENSERSIKESMEYFAANMSGEGIRQVTVFNPLSWKQTRWIIASVALHKGEAKAFIAKKGDLRIPVRIIESDKFSDGSVLDAKLVFKAELEPLSMNAFSILPAEATETIPEPAIKSDKDSLIIVTPYYKIKLAEGGGITYIKDVKTGQYITKSNQRSAFFSGKIEGQECQGSGRWIIQKMQGKAPWVKLTENGFISDIPYEFEITLYEDNPIIDCKVRFNFNGQKIGLLSDNLRDSHSAFVHEDKLRFKFFPEIDTVITGIRDLPFAIAETKDKYIEGNYWTAISGKNSGIAFFNKGNMCSIREKDNSFSIPLAFAMYYIWGTRMLYGPFQYEFAILPFHGDWKNAGLHKKALEYSFPLPSIESKPGSGKLGGSLNTFAISTDDDVIMTAMYPHKDVIVARFFRFSDHRPDSGFIIEKKGFPVNEITMDGDFLRKVNERINLKPWEIKTFQIGLQNLKRIPVTNTK